MMQFRKNGMLLLAIFCFFIVVSADIPPDPGYKRISLKLIVEAQEDFPDYRFFIKSGSDLEEIVLKKGERSTIGPLGGGAFYRAGTFLAVPKKSLAGLSETASNDKLNELQKAIYDGKVAGTIELIKHSFAREVREAEASGLKDPVYRIEKDADKGLKAVLVSGGANESKTATNSGLSSYSKEIKTPLFWATVIGGGLMTLALISLGVWLIRRSKMRSG